MQFLLVICFSILAALVSAAPAPSAPPCTKTRRLAIVMEIIGAFNDPNPVSSASTLSRMPFKPDGTIELSVLHARDFVGAKDTDRSMYSCINGAPCTRVGYNADTSRAAAITARQGVAHVDSKYVAFDNGTTVMDAVVTFGAGALGVPVPVKTAIYVPGDFDTKDCLIRDLPAYFTLPNEVGGMPVTPPKFPDLGIGTIPGVRLKE